MVSFKTDNKCSSCKLLKILCFDVFPFFRNILSRRVLEEPKPRPTEYLKAAASATAILKILESTPVGALSHIPKFCYKINPFMMDLKAPSSSIVVFFKTRVSR